MPGSTSMDHFAKKWRHIPQQTWAPPEPPAHIATVFSCPRQIERRREWSRLQGEARVLKGPYPFSQVNARKRDGQGIFRGDGWVKFWHLMASMGRNRLKAVLTRPRKLVQVTGDWSPKLWANLRQLLSNKWQLQTAWNYLQMPRENNENWVSIAR